MKLVYINKEKLTFRIMEIKNLRDASLSIKLHIWAVQSESMWKFSEAAKVKNVKIKNLLHGWKGARRWFINRGAGYLSMETACHVCNLQWPQLGTYIYYVAFLIVSPCILIYWIWYIPTNALFYTIMY
jgi:hypothetical protein